MVQWSSNEEILRDKDVLVKLMHVTAGIYFWEFLVSLDFDLSFIRGRKRFNWPMIPYFLTRIFGLAGIIAILLSLNITAQTNCQSLYMFISTSTAVSGGTASLYFAIRTMAIWGMELYCVAAVSLLIAGHWAILILAIVKTNASWEPGSGCVSHTAATAVIATSISTLVFDFIVLTLSTFRLMRGSGKSRLVNLMFKDGLIYLAIVFISSVVAAVLAFLRLNPVMDVIGAFPAHYVHVIGSCRAVRRLSNFSSESPMTAIPRNASVIAFQPRDSDYPTSSSTLGRMTPYSDGDGKSDGVQIQVETFTTTSESEQNSIGRKMLSKTHRSMTDSDL